jgi:hypothetical protein
LKRVQKCVNKVRFMDNKRQGNLLTASINELLEADNVEQKVQMGDDSSSSPFRGMGTTYSLYL